MHESAVYRQAAVSMGELPLFLNPWWLDATCGPDGWSGVVAGDAHRPAGLMPFKVSHRLGFVVLTQPKLTQHLGPWLSPGVRAHGPNSAEAKDVMEELIDRLPRHDHYAQNWSPNMDDWLPFHWRGYEQTTRYTYQIPPRLDSNATWGRLRPIVKRAIKKARDKNGLTVTSTGALDVFLHLNDMTFARQGLATPYPRKLVESIDSECASRKQRAIFAAVDGAGRPHASVYVVWDQHTAYYLMGGSDPVLRSSGASSLCLWHAIEFAAALGLAFDFEGSMIRPIERYVRAFGGVATPYFHVSRTPSRLLMTALFLRKLRRTTS